MWLFLTIVVIVLLHTVHSQIGGDLPLSPCPRIFWYENDGQAWYGVIELGPPYPRDLILLVEMDIGINLPSSYVGRIELLGQRSNLIVNIVNGKKIKYQIHFPVLDAIPVITKVVFNNKIVCNGPHLNSGVVTSIDLKHVLNTNLENGNYDDVNYYQNLYDVSDKNRPYTVQNSVTNPRPQNFGGEIYFEDEPAHVKMNQSPHRESSTQKAVRVSEQRKQNSASNRKQPWQYNDKEERPNPDNFASFSVKPTKPINMQTISSYIEKEELTNVCGVPRSINPLIIGGESTKKGDWPWLVALFVKKVSSLNFICGGTLVSKDTIVTAAHCMLEKNNRPVKTEEVIVKLGVFNLQDWTDEDTKTLAVRQIISHPAYDGGLGLRNDIAILKIDRVNYSTYIIPSCLWSGNLNLDSFVGKSGVTIGWGRDEKGLLATPEPRMSRQKLVTLNECREANTAFVFFTSNTTFCAGNRDGTGPCNGDSGGGMFLYIDGKWRLRGIISTSLNDPSSQNVCDLSYYVIYTDVSKYIEWITSYM